MSGAAAGGGAAAVVYAAALSNAVKACGTLIMVEPQEFLQIVGKQNEPLVVRKRGGMFSSAMKYLTSYKGLAFHCKTSTELRLPPNTELIEAKKFSMPDL